MDPQGIPNIQNNLGKEQNWKTTICDFKTYYNDTVIKIVKQRHKYRPIDQWNRTETSEIISSIHSQKFFDKGDKTIQWGKRQSSKQMVLGKLSIHMRKNEFGPLTNSMQKMNSKWIKHLNVQLKQ